MYQVMQAELITPDTALTISGGATPAVTGGYLLVSDMVSPMSLFLVNDGASTDLTVTYQIGFIDSGDCPTTPTITWVTPADGGTVTDLTNVNIATSKKHASISLACAKYYRFIVTNADAGNIATVCLYGVLQTYI